MIPITMFSYDLFSMIPLYSDPVKCLPVSYYFKELFVPLVMSHGKRTFTKI